jgi:hypothetical protein
MTVNYIEVLDLTGIAEQKDMKTSFGIGNMHGKVIGLMDNQNANLLKGVSIWIL